MDVHRQKSLPFVFDTMQQGDGDGAQHRPDKDSAHNNPSHNSSANDGAGANNSVESVDGGGVSGGTRASNGTRGASFGHQKIAGQAPAASVGVGGEPTKTEATPRWVNNVVVLAISSTFAVAEMRVNSNLP